MLYCKETSGYHIDPPHSCVSYADLLLLGTELSLFPFLILSNRWTDIGLTHMVITLMMSAKMAILGLLKIKVF